MSAAFFAGCTLLSFFYRGGYALYLLHSGGGGYYRVNPVKHRRIDQYRVFTQQSPGWPASFNDKIEIRFQYRVIGRHHDPRAAIGVNIDVKLDAGEKIGSVEPQFFKIFFGCQANLDFIRMQAARIEQIYP